ncbi:Hypothetical predicted protein, partial [Paramuricea clavata]
LDMILMASRSFLLRLSHFLLNDSKLREARRLLLREYLQEYLVVEMNSQPRYLLCLRITAFGIAYRQQAYKAIDEPFVRKMLESFCVDDLVSGECTTDKAYTLYEKAKDRCTSKSGEHKVLGLARVNDRDAIKFSFDVVQRAVEWVATRRNVLCLLADIFDPLGLISSILVELKVLFQELCVAGLGSDDEFHGIYKQKWNSCLGQMGKVGEICINRCVKDWGEVDVGARFLYLSTKLKHFRNHRHREYLSDLREHHDGKGNKNNARTVKVGEVEIVSEEGKKRGQWRTGIVEKLMVGRERVVRRAKIRTIKDGKPSRLHRPLQSPYPTSIYIFVPYHTSIYIFVPYPTSIYIFVPYHTSIYIFGDHISNSVSDDLTSNNVSDDLTSNVFSDDLTSDNAVE